tara:strand:+ start:327 stop:1892 length:1566 start_codon:yes stop_codon:yes gene_type:complete
MPSTDIKDYWRRSWGIGDRVGKPGGLVEPGTEFYAKEVILTETMKENITAFEAQEGKGSYNKAKAYLKKRVRDGIWTGTGSGGANIRSTEEILELVKRTENGDVLIKEWMKNPTKENPVFDKLRETAKKRKTYENQMYTTKKKYEEFRKKKRIQEKKFEQSETYKNYQKKKMSQKGMFPAVDSKERLWRDIWRATNQKAGSRFKVVSKIPKAIISENGVKYIPWHNNYKNVVFLDTKTNKKITYEGLEKYMNKYIGKNTYKNAVKNYDIKKLLESEPIKFKGKNTTVGQVLRQGILSEKELKANKGFSAIEVNHKGANLDEFWNTEVTTRNANRKLVPLKSRYKKMFALATTQEGKAKIIKEFTKEVEKLPGGVRTIFEGAEVGIEPTAKKVITAAAKDTGLLYSKPFKSFVNSLPVKVAKGIFKMGARTVGAAMPVIGPGLIAWGVSDANKAYAAGLTKPDELTVAYNLGPEIAQAWSNWKTKEKKATLAGEAGLPEIDAFSAKDGGLSGVDQYLINRYK